jgi:hypothetical protein
MGVLKEWAGIVPGLLRPSGKTGRGYSRGEREEKIT